VADALGLWAVWFLVALLLAAALAAIGIAVRRILLEHGGGNVECGLRRGQGEPWRLGLAAYTPDELRWFSAFGVRLRPDAVFARNTMAIVARRPATAAEETSVGSRAVVIECRVGRETAGNGRRRTSAGPVELAMGEAALTGFLAWLEAAPPGRVVGLN
jgi:hypothetical protein